MLLLVAETTLGVYFEDYRNKFKLAVPTSGGVGVIGGCIVLSRTPGIGGYMGACCDEGLVLLHFRPTDPFAFPGHPPSYEHVLQLLSNCCPQQCHCSHHYALRA